MIETPVITSVPMQPSVGNAVPVSAPVVPAPQTPSANKPPMSKKPLFLIGGILIFLLLIGGIFWSLQKGTFPLSGTSSQPTPVPNILLATVGDQKIYRNDVYKIAAEQYVPSAINNAVLKRFLDTAIERAILDITAKQMNITVSDAEVKTYLLASKLSDKSFNISKYMILKNKVMAAQVKNVQAYTIGFWLPPLSSPQKPEYAQERIDGQKALVDISQRLSNAEVPLSVTQYIYTTYPTLQSRLALNGYIFATTQNKSLMAQPKIFTFNASDLSKPYTNNALYDAAAAMIVNEVRIVQQDPGAGSGGDVIKVSTIQGTGYTNYNDFLQAKKKELAKNYNAL